MTRIYTDSLTKFKIPIIVGKYDDLFVFFKKNFPDDLDIIDGFESAKGACFYLQSNRGNAIILYFRASESKHDYFISVDVFTHELFHLHNMIQKNMNMQDEVVTNDDNEEYQAYHFGNIYRDVQNICVNLLTAYKKKKDDNIKNEQEKKRETEKK